MEIKNLESNCIYKFYPPTEYSLDALLNHYFWFCKREYLNDPFDLGNFRKGRTIINKHFLNQIISHLQKCDAIEPAQIIKKIPEYASCSFTKDSLNKQMWAYYARDYSGWCLGFDRGEVRVKQESILSPVIYVNDNCIPLKTINTTLYGQDPLENMLRQVLCIKHESWKCEDEERIVVRMKNVATGEPRDWGTFRLREIIVGNKISLSYKHLVCRLADIYHVPVYEISTKSRIDFQLDKIKIQ